MLLKNPKEGISLHKLLTQEEVHCPEAPQHSLLIPHHIVFGHLKLLATMFFVEAMPQIEEPGKVAYEIPATALEVGLWVGKSYKHLLSSKVFLALLFHYIYPACFHCKMPHQYHNQYHSSSRAQITTETLLSWPLCFFLPARICTSQTLPGPCSG